MELTREKLEQAIENEKALKKEMDRSIKGWIIASAAITLLQLVLLDVFSFGLGGWIVMIVLDLVYLYYLPYIMTLTSKRARRTACFAEYRDSFRYSRKYKNHTMLSIEIFNDFGRCDWEKYIDSLLENERKPSNRFMLLQSKESYLNMKCRFDEASAVCAELEKCAPKYARDRIIYKRLVRLGESRRSQEFASLFEENRDYLATVSENNLAGFILVCSLSSGYELIRGNYQRALELAQMALEGNTADRMQKNWAAKYPNFVLIGEIERYCDIVCCYVDMGDFEHASSGLELIDKRLSELTSALPDFYAHLIAEFQEKTARGKQRMIEEKPES